MNPQLIGITGGIGSGKSIVARIITILGYPVYNADDEAGFILEKNQLVVSEVKKLIGENAYSENNIPDRKFIASVVFENSEKLRALNSIIHPAVQLHFQEWVKQHPESEMLFKEAAILFESGSYKAM